MLFKQKELPFYYSSYAIKQEYFHKFFHLKPQLEIVLSRAAMKNIYLAAPLIKRTIRRTENLHLYLLDAQISLLLNNRSRFHHIIEHTKINLSKIPLHLKAQYLYLSALNKLYLTDMLSASQQCSAALKIYQKLNFTYETAECYQALAHIYRISGVHDVAFTMLKEAQKAYSLINMKAKIAEINAYLGLNEIGRENYKTAHQYLITALEITNQYKLFQTRSAIYNWLGLTRYLNQNLQRAKYYFQKAWTSNQTPESKAFATEMLARIYLQQQNYRQALTFAKRAFITNKQIQNPAGIFENLYLQAEILYILEKYSESEAILTRLIRRKSAPSTIFYPANAYTLLGLVNLKKNNLTAAETLFKQAADLEHSQNRLKGAAIDYNNLAEIAHQQGMYEMAATYLKQALSYAESINDKELISYLSSKLK